MDENGSSDLVLFQNALVQSQTGYGHPFTMEASSPLTQPGMADFVPGSAVIDAAQRKRVKYKAKCATIGYGFLSFSFSSLGELGGMQLRCSNGSRNSL
nr:hypothetical protein [Tanacetum cinerariifolium]